MAEENAERRAMEDVVRSEIEKENLQATIDQMIREVVSEEVGRSSHVNLETVVARLLDSITVQSMVQRVLAGCTPQQSTHPPVGNLPGNLQEQVVQGRRYLYLRVCGGRAFVDYLGKEGIPSPAGGQASLNIHLALHNQRFAIYGVPCVCEPKINEGFLFDLQHFKPDHCNMLNNSELLTLDAPITVAVVRQEGDQGTPTSLLSVHILEWRSLLAQPSPTSKVVCQLMGIGSEHEVPVGLLDIEVTLVPPVGSPLQAPVVSKYLEEIKNQRGERRRLFRTYAQKWWQEYLNASTSHSSRLVQMFAMDECGKYRFVCEFVRKFEVGRMLKSPEEAARWVSVMPVIPIHHLPACSNRLWFTLPIAVIARSLSTESKCTLLCSILLGYGLDAWVCVGTRRSGTPHAWVMMRGPYSAVTFWEAATGSRYLHKVGQKAAHDYGSIGSVFNNKHFYANCQTSDKIEYCNFFLEDSSAWKMMSSSATSSMTEKRSCLIPLTPAACDENKRSTDMEVKLRLFIIEHRSDNGLSAHFDEHLCYMLTPALWSYERNATEGDDDTKSRGAELFSAALMHTVPEGHIFKAFPLHFVHCSPRRAFSTILK
nr:centrosomal protein of 76 kDa-like [Procambarus clarkii]